MLAVGILSLLGNELRLALHDLGMALPPATFLGALAVGLLASLAQAALREPRIALTVPGIIIMTPGIYAFQTIVMLNQGDILAGDPGRHGVRLHRRRHGDGVGRRPFHQRAAWIDRALTTTPWRRRA